MSLIVATSRIGENQQAGNPSNFKNFYRSPIEIEADSEIAVQSVKVERSGNIVVGEGDFFCHYFGTDPVVSGDFLRLTSLSRKIVPTPGTYSISRFTEIVQNALNTQYDDPRTFGGYLVKTNTDTSGKELGLEISCVDKGSASNTEVSGSLTAVPTYNITSPTYGTETFAPSDGFTWTAASGSFADNVASTHEAVGVLTGAPFGLNEGRFIVKTVSASAQPYHVGLTRPQLQIETYKNSQSSVPEFRERGVAYLFKPDLNQVIDDHTGGGFIQRDGEEMYDYVVFNNTGEDKIHIAERIYIEPEPDEFSRGLEPLDYPGSGDYRLKEISYWDNAYTGNTGAILTKAQFHASWDGIMFQGKGDEIELYFKQNGKDVYDKVVSSDFSNTPGRCFNPIGSTSYALYPQMRVGTGQTLVVDKYESKNPIGSYKYPTFETGDGFTKFTPGDDMFSNERFYGASKLKMINITRSLSSNSMDNMIFVCDSSEQKQRTIDGELITTDYAFSGLNASKGVDYNHIFTTNTFSQPHELDTTGGLQEYPNMSATLGFADRAFLDSDDPAGYVSGDDTLTVKFTSTRECEKSAIASFIRIPNLTHKSFNGAQSGLSKILYHLPMFTNDGRQFGSLHFEPGEKTYVKLHNPGPMLLNQLDIQIVNGEEKELDSLTGDTQIVLHIRKSKG